MDRICSTLLFMVLCSQSSAGESQLIGSPDPIVAVAGDDVILPCSLEPPIDAQNLTVEWTRPDLKPADVHLYKDGRNNNDDQNPLYKDRTMLEGEVVRGNVFLKLSRVELEDEGSYTCLVIKDGQFKKTVIQLRVVVISKPEVTILEAREDGVGLQCESGGWYPEPKLEWRDSEGRLLPADVPQTDRHPDPGPHQRYTVRSRVTVQKTDTNRFTCRVHLQGLNQTRETEIHVPDSFFPPTDKWSKGAIIGSVIGVVGVVVTVGTAGFLWWWKKSTAGSKNVCDSEPEQLVLPEATRKRRRRRGQ